MLFPENSICSWWVCQNLQPRLGQRVFLRIFHICENKILFSPFFFKSYLQFSFTYTLTLHHTSKYNASIWDDITVYLWWKPQKRIEVFQTYWLHAYWRLSECCCDINSSVHTYICMHEDFLCRLKVFSKTNWQWV